MEHLQLVVTPEKCSTEGALSGTLRPRLCAVCAADLTGRRSHARTCSPQCRKHLFRWPRSKVIERRWGIDPRDLWRTPGYVVEAVRRALRRRGADLTLDAAAFPEDAVCPAWISPEENSLSTSWASRALGGWAWWNPTYSDPAPWVSKAAAEARAGCSSVALLPSCTGARWWAELAAAAEVLVFIRGRVAFLHPDTGRPVSGTRFDSALAFLSDGRGPARAEVVELALLKAWAAAPLVDLQARIPLDVPSMFPALCAPSETLVPNALYGACDIRASLSFGWAMAVSFVLSSGGSSGSVTS